MALVSPEDVLSIINSSLDGNALMPFIEAAHLIVSEDLSDKGFSESRLTEIEKWLSAHFLAVRDPRLQAERVGQAQANYEGRASALDRSLMSTQYGQQAIALDTSGTLSNMGNKMTATIEAL